MTSIDIVTVVIDAYSLDALRVEALPLPLGPVAVPLVRPVEGHGGEHLLTESPPGVPLSVVTDSAVAVVNHRVVEAARSAPPHHRLQVHWAATDGENK